MPLLSGPASIARFDVAERPEEPELERFAFREIAPGSEVRESVGFLPMEPEAPYRVGHSRFAFRVRIDKLRPDPTAVRERLADLVRAERQATGYPFVGAKKRRKLRQLAEEELIVEARPRAKIIEACLDDDLLYVGSTAKSYLGTVILLLRQAGVLVAPKAPWLEPGGDGEAPEALGFIETHEPGQSALGCEFLRALVEDRELTFEPESGSVRLQTHEAKVSLSGAVLNDLFHYLDKGAAVLAAKLTSGEVTFRLDALSWRLSGLRLEVGRHDHWTELLDERLEGIAAVWDLLDAKYAHYVGGGVAVG